jgi:Rrf2 family protein
LLFREDGKLLKWSQAVLLAFHAMALLAGRKDDVITVDELAKSLGVSPDHLSKVMQRLSKSNIVKSVRGPSGGYTLSADPETLPLLDIYQCVEGELATRTCMLHESGCGGEKCIFGNMMGSINKTASDYLSSTMLSDVASIDVGSQRG